MEISKQLISDAQLLQNRTGMTLYESLQLLLKKAEVETLESIEKEIEKLTDAVISGL